MTGFFHAVRRLFVRGDHVRGPFGRSAFRRARPRSYEPELSILRLEPRRLLNADFGLTPDAIQLDLTDPTATDTLTISRDGDSFRFELGGGLFSGTDGGGLTGDGSDTLEISIADAQGLSGGIQVFDNGDLDVVLAEADFSSLGGGLRLIGIDSVTSDGGPFQAPTLTVISYSETPFQLAPLDFVGDVSITAASSIDDSAASGRFRVDGDLSLTAGLLPGDYNRDARVTTDDFIVWQDNTGSTGDPGIVGDGNGDGQVNAADFSLWRDALGRSADAASSEIDLGLGLNVQVTGAADFESIAGGDLRVGATQADRDSGRVVELGTASFETTGDAKIIEDSTDGLTVAQRQNDGGPNTPSVADDVFLSTTRGDALLAGLTADDLTVVAAGSILEDGAGGGSVVVASDAAFNAGVLAADFDGSGVVDVADYAIWRDNFGAAGGPGDANGDGQTDVADFTVWRDTLGLGGPAGSRITIGDQIDLDVGGVAEFTSGGGGEIRIGQTFGGALGSNLNIVRFDTSGDVAITDSSTDSFRLQRVGNGLAGRGRSVTLETRDFNRSNLVLDSLQAESLIIFSNSGVTDAAGAQIEVTGVVDIDSQLQITLADTAGDRFTTSEASLVSGFDPTIEPAGIAISVGEAGVAEFRPSVVLGTDIFIRNNAATDLGIINASSFTLISAGDITSSQGSLAFVRGRLVTTDPGADIQASNLFFSEVTLSFETTESSPGAADANVTVSAENNIVIDASHIEGDLSVTSSFGDITDADRLTVTGDASFAAPGPNADITLDQLAAAGSIGLTGAAGQATLVNATGVDFSASNVQGALSITALKGDITNSGAITAGPADFTAVEGDITLGQAADAAFGALSLDGRVVTVDETDDILLDTVSGQTLTLSTNAAITDGSSAVIDVAGAATFNGLGGVSLADSADDRLDVGGLATFNAAGVTPAGINVGGSGRANFGALSLFGAAATIVEQSGTVLQDVDVASLNLTSDDDITDNSNLVIMGPATFTSVNGAIVLADNPGDPMNGIPGDVLTVTGAATFIAAQDIELGLGGAANFGSVSLSGDDAALREMSPIQFGAVNVDSLTATSAGMDAGDITDTLGMAITVDGPASFTTPADVILGAGGAASFGSLMLNADEAVIIDATSTRIDGVDVRRLDLTSGGGVSDLPGTVIDVEQKATITATGSLLLANSPGDRFTVGSDMTNGNAIPGTDALVGDAHLTATGAIAVGVAGQANFGRLMLEGTAVVVQEDSSTVLKGVTAESLDLTSAGDISDIPSATLAVSGDASFTAAGDLTIGPGSDATFGTLTVDAADAFVQEDDSTAVAGVRAANFTIESDGSITDLPNTSIDVAGAARFVAEGLIALADAATPAFADSLVVGGNALFFSTIGATIDVGVAIGGPADGDPIGSTVSLGSVSFRSASADQSVTGRVRIAEDDAMVVTTDGFSGMPAALNLGGEVVLIADDSGGAANTTAASITVDGPVTATAGLRLQSDGPISQTAAGRLVSPVLQTVSGFDVAALLADPDPATAPTRSAAFTPDVTLDAAANAINQFAALTANGSVRLVTSEALEIASTTVDGRQLAGITIIDARNALQAADASQELVLELTSTGGGITQAAVDVIDPDFGGDLHNPVIAPVANPAFVPIDVDVARATFTVPDGASIRLLDAVVDSAEPGDDSLLLNFDAVRSATQNRFFNDNPAVQAETELVFQASAGRVADVAVADQTAVELGFASDTTFELSLAGELIVVAGRSPVAVADEAITQGRTVTADGDAQFHAAGNAARPESLGGDIVLEDLVIGGAVAVTTDSGDATLAGPGTLAFRTDIKTNVRDGLTAGDGNLSVTSSGADITDAAGAKVFVAGDATFTTLGAITLADSAADVLSVAGDARFVSLGAGDIRVGVVALGMGVSGSDDPLAPDRTTDSGATVTLGGTNFDSRNAGDTDRGDVSLFQDAVDKFGVGGFSMELFGQNSAQSLAATSRSVITDRAATTIQVNADALFRALGSQGAADPRAITLADSGADDELTVGGDAAFESAAGADIVVGVGVGDDPTVTQRRTDSGATVSLGGTNFSSRNAGDTQRGDVTLLEDDSTEFFGQSFAGSLVASTQANTNFVDSISDRAATVIDVNASAFFTALAAGNITLADEAGDVIRVGADLQTPAVGAPGLDEVASFTTPGDITIGPAGSADFETLSLDGNDVAVQEDSTTILNTVAANKLRIDSEGDLRDVFGASIDVTAEGTFLAGGDIVLSNEGVDQITVALMARFTALGGVAPVMGVPTGGDITIGEPGVTDFGTLSLTGRVAFVEEDFTTVLDQVLVNQLTLRADIDILDTAAASIQVFSTVGLPGDATLTAEGGITLANDPGTAMMVEQLFVDGHASFTAGAGFSMGAAPGNDIAIGAAGLVNFGTLSLFGDEAAVQEDSGTTLNVVDVRQLTLVSDGPIGDAALTRGGIVTDPEVTVAGLATLTAQAPNPSPAPPTPQDIVLGDQTAVLELNNLNIIAAADVSLQEQTDLDLAGVTISGTFFTTTAGGSIVQLPSSAPLVADAIGVRTTGGGVLINSAAINRFAAEADGAVDIAGVSADLDALLTELNDARIDAGTPFPDLPSLPASVTVEAPDGQGLAPTQLVFDGPTPMVLDPLMVDGSIPLPTPADPAGFGRFETLAIDSLFGVVLLVNRGDLTIGQVIDATGAANGGLVEVDGVRSERGHAFVETNAAAGGGGGAAEPGRIVFDAAGIADSAAAFMQGDHVLTAVASGDLIINTDTNTLLVAVGELFDGERGVVTDVSGYNTFDDRDFLISGETVASVAKEGAQLLLTPPDDGAAAPTSRNVGAATIGVVDPMPGVEPPGFTQSVQVTIGRAGEENLSLLVTFADGDVAANRFDPGTVNARHTFEEDFVSNANEENDFFPNLPTTIQLFNDARINLFSEGGRQNLNRSVTPSDAPPPARLDNFVLATTFTTPIESEQPVPPAATVRLVRPAPVVFQPRATPPPSPQNFVPERSSVQEDQPRITFGPLDELKQAEGNEVEIVAGAENDWNGGAENFEAEIKALVFSNDGLPAGKYVIEVDGGERTEAKVFEKRSTVADPSPTATSPGGGAVMPTGDASGVAGLEDPDAWTEAWSAWAPPTEGAAPESGPAADASAALGAEPAARDAAMVDGVAGNHRHQSAGVDALMIGGVLLTRRQERQRPSKRRRGWSLFAGRRPK